MDIKKTVEDLVAKITKDKTLVNKFRKDPMKTVKSLVDFDLSKDQLNSLVDGVKAKVSLDEASNILDKAKGLFK